MPEAPPVPLAELTTLRLGGSPGRLVEATTEAELVDVVRSCDAAGEPVLVLGGGSNLVVSDDGFHGTVVAVRTRGLDIGRPDCGGVTLTVAAGEPWDDVVAAVVDRELVGIEALSGIPGSTGAVPVQNVGAYGQEVSQTIASVRTWDRQAQAQRTFATADCGFAYRSSRFKTESPRYLVLDVTFQLLAGQLSAPVRYAELARRLGVELGERAPLPDVRAAVLRLRRGKGMVLDAADHDTWSAGSFFTNPVLDADTAARLPVGAPRWTQADGSVKTSAAWLIDAAGFAKGHSRGAVALSEKHPLALTNRGGGTSKELLELAREIRDGVAARFGIQLVNEPVTIGCSL
jgi:UDP-N-acetylmuramate dehydrogenase